VKPPHPGYGGDMSRMTTANTDHGGERPGHPDNLTAGEGGVGGARAAARATGDGSNASASGVPMGRKFSASLMETSAGTPSPFSSFIDSLQLTDKEHSDLDSIPQTFFYLKLAYKDSSAYELLKVSQHQVSMCIHVYPCLFRVYFVCVSCVL